jgi:1-acyl-sn-glycerol-3-phosphate acyltransferase
VSLPLKKPTWPTGVPRPPVNGKLGADFDTRWARSPAARFGRALLLDNVIRPAVHVLADPVVRGIDRLEGLQPPVIFVANHASHLDTPLLLVSLPQRFRHKTVVAAAADYFFDRRVKGYISAMGIAAFPVDRTTANRKALDLASDLLADGWSLVIYPEGGRTPDGWLQPFQGGAAFLAGRANVPIVPVFIEGTRRIMRKGATAVRKSSTTVVFGRPIDTSQPRKNVTARLETAVATLADECRTDWWSARRRAAAGNTPSLVGPAAGAWRRSWAVGAPAASTTRRCGWSSRAAPSITPGA